MHKMNKNTQSNHEEKEQVEDAQETSEEESGIDKKLVGDLNLLLHRSGL